jgi:hypothetical protein
MENAGITGYLTRRRVCTGTGDGGVGIMAGVVASLFLESK